MRTTLDSTLASTVLRLSILGPQTGCLMALTLLRSTGKGSAVCLFLAQLKLLCSSSRSMHRNCINPRAVGYTLYEWDFRAATASSRLRLVRSN